MDTKTVSDNPTSLDFSQEIWDYRFTNLFEVFSKCSGMLGSSAFTITG